MRARRGGHGRESARLDTDIPPLEAQSTPGGDMTRRMERGIRKLGSVLRTVAIAEASHSTALERVRLCHKMFEHQLHRCTGQRSAGRRRVCE